jgi:hypothetical protein
MGSNQDASGEDLAEQATETQSSIGREIDIQVQI